MLRKYKSIQANDSEMEELNEENKNYIDFEEAIHLPCLVLHSFWMVMFGFWLEQSIGNWW